MQGTTYSRALPVQCDALCHIKILCTANWFLVLILLSHLLISSDFGNQSTPLKWDSYFREDLKMLPALSRNFELQLKLPTRWVQQWRRPTSHFCHFCSEIWQFGGTIEPMKISSTIHEGRPTQTDSQQQRTA